MIQNYYNKERRIMKEEKGKTNLKNGKKIKILVWTLVVFFNSYNSNFWNLHKISKQNDKQCKKLFIWNGFKRRKNNNINTIY